MTNSQLSCGFWDHWGTMELRRLWMSPYVYPCSLGHLLICLCICWFISRSPGQSKGSLVPCILGQFWYIIQRILEHFYFWCTIYPWFNNIEKCPVFLFVMLEFLLISHIPSPLAPSGSRTTCPVSELPVPSDLILHLFSSFAFISPLVLDLLLTTYHQ